MKRTTTSAIVQIAALTGFALLLSGAPATADTEARNSSEAQTSAEPGVVEVRMTEVSPNDMRFEPADLTVWRGDVVRFVHAGAMPHNVEFRRTPSGARLGSLRQGPFLTEAGETYEFTIDERFAPGTYRYVCTPHAMVGMVGALTVVERGEPSE